jgi:hypothetical protein
MLKQPLHKRWLVFFSILSVSLFLSFTASATERIPALSIDKTTVTWKQLSFKGKEFFAKLSAEIKLISPSESELNAAFIPSTQGTPMAITKFGALVIDTKISVKSFLGKIKLQKIAWFDPVTLSAMQYIRLRREFNDSEKTYRFTNKGIFRIAKKPIDKNEIIQPPERWSVSHEEFYPYDSEKKNCANITAPIPVIYLISALETSDFEKPVTICVFNKKKTVYLDIQKEPSEAFQLNHIEVKDDKAIHKNTSILADVLSLKARSISSGQAIDNFTLVGLQGDLRVYIDPESRTPVQLRGDYKSFGEIKLNLRQMVYK